MPLVLWGNGGCRDNGLSASHFLREIASHGYFVVANGAARQEPPVLEKLPQAPATDPIPEGVEVRPPRGTPDETSVKQLLAAIDWAEAADRNPDHKFYDRIDTSQVAAMGHSCGGLQALAAGLDQRITTVVALASGVYGVESSPPGNVEIIQADLAGLHTPVAFILGGPGDIAYRHGTKNFELINNVPVLSASLPVGHGGTFRLENGGEWARVATAWLDWQMKGSHDAARWFFGNDCLLCRAKDWEVRKKHFPEIP
jgi:dienelactone hydrolase